MDKPEVDSVLCSTEDTVQLSRNRSFKSKQLVRSQAIRETHSPPRTSSPAVDGDNETTRDPNAIGVTVNNNAGNVINNADNVNDSNNVDNVISNSETRTLSGITSENSSHSDSCSDGVSYVMNNDYNDYNNMKQQPVEIQYGKHTAPNPSELETGQENDADDFKITSGGWDVDQHSDQRLRTKRWLGHRDRSESSRDLLSNNPRVACVCGNCAACPHCRGRRRKQYCPTKQDSGIVCSDECPDCSDNEASGPNYEGGHKTGSLDAEDLNYYCRCPEKKEKPKNTTLLTRTDSDEKSEPTGPELVNFIKETLNKNARDRMTLLKIEKELHALINDTGRCIVRFPVMTSYGRMLVHRCASLFQLSHHLDQASKTCVMVSKSGTSGGRIPCTSFRQWCTVNFPPSPQRYQPDSINARSILKRDTHSLDEPSGGAMPSNRSKSLEQREKEYERVRRRIFSSDNCAQDESQWPWMSGPVKVLTSEAGRNKLLKVQSLESSTPGCWRARGAVSKSHSFSGPAPDTTAAPSRLLSRQGDLASSSWRLSPSSSGYKTLSLRSTDSVTPSPTGGASPEPVLGGIGTEGVVWAVTDLNSVPPGAVVIHPQTGRPLTNPDGSLYHFDPAHPPVLYDIAYKHEEFKNENSEKKRGRLEKQHSFIDNDCECQPSEECQSKCCSECRRHETCQTKTTIDKETNTKPETPKKIKSDNNQNHTPDMNNHKPVYDKTANDKPSYDDQDDHKPTFETPPPNQNTVENARPYETTNRTHDHYQNQRVDVQRNYEAVKGISVTESTNHQPVINEVRASNLTNQESRESQQYHNQYGQGYSTDEMTSPTQATSHLMQAEVGVVQPTVAKVTPSAMPDPNIRPVSLTNVMYPTGVPQGYPYGNQCRLDQALPTSMYQGMVPADEAKQLAPSPHVQDTAFRIDPSYPYGAIEYASSCGACYDTNLLQQNPHRSYSVPYNQMEMQPVLQPTYPIGNVLLSQPHLHQPYPYQDAVQWTNVQPAVAQPPKLLVPDIYPLVQYTTPYPQYNLMYPQVISQPYPVCQPVYPVVEKQAEFTAPRNNFRGRSKHSSCGHTPLQTPPEVGLRRDTPPRRQDNSDIATKIQQIKEQMAQLNAKDKDKERKRDDWKRRSSNGLLGNYPTNSNYNERNHGGRIINDESQLSNEARVIVNSIRNMQSKNTYQGEGRAQGQRSPRVRGGREEARHSAPEWHHGRARPVHPLSTGVYRPPYLFRQMSPNAWCRRSPGPVHPVLNNPRRPHPDSRNGGRR